MRQRAVTLPETVIALFILTSAFIVTAALFDRAIRYQSVIERRVLAVQLAQKRLDQLRIWARTSTGGSSFNFDQSDSGWETALASTDPDYPGFTVSFRVQNQVLYSPCTSMEQPLESIDPTLSRRMNNSARKVKVTVTDDGTGASTELVTLVADPTRDLDLVTLQVTTPGPDPLEPSGNVWTPNAGSTVEFSVAGYRADGTQVPDLFFDWYAIPLGGNGTIQPSRDGRTAMLINGVRTTFGLGTISTGGKVTVAAHGSYRGHGQPPQTWNPVTGNRFIGVALPPFNLKP